jgi:DNA-binding GntR family transcriptional regulator
MRKRPGRLPETVGRELREAILDGRLKPGTRIRQDDIARQYGTSRVPVREALRELAGEGLVTIEPAVGARVRPLDLEELVEVYLMRERLEPLALEESTGRLMAGDVTHLRRLLEDTETCARAGDLTGYIAIDRRFHFESYRPSGRERLLRVIEGLWNTTEQYRRLYALLPQRVEVSITEHRLILGALEDRSAANAAELLQVHIRRTRLTLMTHRELFTERGEQA